MRFFLPSDCGKIEITMVSLSLESCILWLSLDLNPSILTTGNRGGRINMAINSDTVPRFEIRGIQTLDVGPGMSFWFGLIRSVSLVKAVTEGLRIISSIARPLSVT